jgi:hypothetical protein
LAGKGAAGGKLNSSSRGERGSGPGDYGYHEVVERGRVVRGYGAAGGKLDGLMRRSGETRLATRPRVICSKSSMRQPQSSLRVVRGMDSVQTNWMDTRSEDAAEDVTVPGREGRLPLESDGGIRSLKVRVRLWPYLLP